MQDKHCHVRAEFRNQPWARVLVGYLPRWASVKPKGIGKDTYQERKRALLRDAMKVVLRPLTRLEKTGVRMQLPAKDGTWHTRTVLMTPALASYDNPEKNKVTGAKDGYKNQWMLCSMYGGTVLTIFVCALEKPFLQSDEVCLQMRDAITPGTSICSWALQRPHAHQIGPRLR
jgi:hypothetical protein